MDRDWLIEFYNDGGGIFPKRTWIPIDHTLWSFSEAAKEAKRREALIGYVYRIRNVMTGVAFPAVIL